MYNNVIVAKMRLVLPSNASSKYFPNNTLSEYTVKLPQRLDLSKGKWEIGLEEIMFYKSWYNLKDASIAYYKEGILVHIVHFPDGFFETASSFIKHLNDTTEKQLPKHFQFRYNSVSRKCTLACKFIRYYNVVISNSLVNIIGKLPNPEKTVVDNGIGYSIYNFKSTLKLEPIFNIMVYSDIAAENVVGDVESPLLRAVPVEKSYWKMQASIFTRIQYVPVSKSQVESISIYIYTDYGEKVPFEDGRVICTLDLRQIVPSYIS